MVLESRSRRVDRRRFEYDNFTISTDLVVDGDFSEDIQVKLRDGEKSNFCIEQIEIIQLSTDVDLTLTLSKVITSGVTDYPIEIATETNTLVNINILDYPIFAKFEDQKIRLALTGDVGILENVEVLINVVVSYF